jgi:hypothetical protein
MKFLEIILKINPCTFVMYSSKKSVKMESENYFS